MSLADTVTITPAWGIDAAYDPKPAHIIAHDGNIEVARKTALPTDSAARKTFPMYSGLLAYYPAALAQVANMSYVGNEKHNPGKPLQHARGVSGDHADCIVRHLVDAMEYPTGSAERRVELSSLAWRALALLQEECELAFAPAAPAANFDRAKK